MKKVWKRLIAVAVATLMLISMLPAAVMAANEQGNPTINPDMKGSITIHKTTEDKDEAMSGAGFTIYRVADLNVDENGHGSYGKTESFKDVEISLDSLNNWSTEKLEAAIAELVRMSKTASDNVKYGEIVTGQDGDAVFSALPLGYYLVVETTVPAGFVASKPFLVAVPSTNAAGDGWEYDITATPKNKSVNVEKQVVDQEGNLIGSTSTAGVGDEIFFQITTTVPTYDESYTNYVFNVNDTMTGLSFNNNIKVYDQKGNQIDENNYKVLTEDIGGKTFVVEFKPDFIEKNKGAEIVVKYSGDITEDALEKNEANNSATITYKNDPNSDETATSEPSKTHTYVYELNVKKTDEEGKLLAGAKFGLYKDAGCETPATKTIKKDGSYEEVDIEFLTTTETGIITFTGLKDGIYYLKELKAPAGYTLLTKPIKVEIEAIKGENGEYTGGCKLKVDGTVLQNNGADIIFGAGKGEVTVINHKGFTLPTTGGIGTYIFTIGGIILMAGAIIVLIAMKKKKTV